MPSFSMRRYSDWRESPRSRAALAITPSWRVQRTFDLVAVGLADGERFPRSRGARSRQHQVGRGDARRACKQAGTTDAVAEFAHVAGPVVTHQCTLGIRQQSISRLEKVLCQRQDVVATVRERRHLQFDDVEPVIEVFTETALPDGFPERCVGRRNDPDVHLAGLAGPEPLELAGLQHAQQLGLPGQGQIADLVEEQRPAVRGFEAAFARLCSPRVGACLGAEQFTLEQVRRQCPCVHPHERPGLRRASWPG